MGSYIKYHIFTKILLASQTLQWDPWAGDRCPLTSPGPDASDSAVSSKQCTGHEVMQETCEDTDHGGLIVARAWVIDVMLFYFRTNMSHVVYITQAQRSASNSY